MTFPYLVQLLAPAFCCRSSYFNSDNEAAQSWLFLYPPKAVVTKIGRMREEGREKQEFALLLRTGRLNSGRE